MFVLLRRLRKTAFPQYGFLLAVWLFATGAAAVQRGPFTLQRFQALFGLGTASVLALAGIVSGSVLGRWSPSVRKTARHGRRLLGWLLLLLGAFVLAGFDKVLETRALRRLPAWAVAI